MKGRGERGSGVRVVKGLLTPKSLEVTGLRVLVLCVMWQKVRQGE